MKPLDCDAVFDVLTRGPFPTGDAIDAPVESHLTCCHECRQLAEALRPAIELLHEAIEPEESRDLPGYHGALTATSRGGLAQMVADAIDAERPARAVDVSPAKPGRWRRLLNRRPTQLEAFLASVVVGALFVLSLAGMGNIEPAKKAQASAFAPTQDGLANLVGLELRPTCFDNIGEAAAVHCCTECHAAQGKTPLAKRAIAVVAVSCRNCHP
jgi:hypothetical protein